MKRILTVVVLIITVISCKQKLNEKDEASIKAQIAMHNATVGLRMKTNQITVDTSQGYFPNTDADLTFEKFINYCTINHRDPIKEANALTIK